MNLILFFCFLVVCVAASALAKKLTWPAAVIGGVLAVLIYFGVGWSGIFLMGVFFLLGTLATSHKKARKKSLGIAMESKAGRTVGQVLANGSAAALCGLLAALYPQHAALYLLFVAAAFSSATADTVSSELGSAYGRRFYDFLTWKKGVRGADGVVSVEGLLFGLAGSVVVAVVYAASMKWTRECFWIIVAGTVGNLADSFFGATLERKGVIQNDAVNFLNTVVAVLVLLLLQEI